MRGDEMRTLVLRLDCAKQTEDILRDAMAVWIGDIRKWMRGKEKEVIEVR
jgi:hypothetical protein